MVVYKGGGLWWIMMVYVGLEWFIMCLLSFRMPYGGSLWFMVVYWLWCFIDWFTCTKCKYSDRAPNLLHPELYSFTVVYDGLKMPIIVYCVLWWLIVVYCGLWWFTMVLKWFVMVYDCFW